MTTQYASLKKLASAKVTPLANNACVQVNRSCHSLVVYGQCSTELYYKLVKNFHITQYSDGECADVTEIDAGLIDCRDAAIALPQTNGCVQPSRIFLLVDDNSFFAGGADALVANEMANRPADRIGHVELITEAEIDRGILNLRLALHKAQQAKSAELTAAKTATAKPDNHKVRQPLHAIGLFASSLEPSLTSNEQKATLSKILTSCNELNSLLNASDKSDYHYSDHGFHDLALIQDAHKSNSSISSTADQSYKVMLIDDDPAVLDATHLLLSEMNCDTYPANNIPEALEILHELDELPDLLVVDYDLGNNTTGDTAIKEICAAAGTQLPAVMVSGSIDHMKNISGNKSIFKVLSKPVNPEVLLSTINHAVAQKCN